MENNFIKSFTCNSQFDSNEQYHGNKDYIGSTSLKVLKQSPLHFINQEKKETDALVFGSAYHCFILEPEKFEHEYYVIDDSEYCRELIEHGKLDAKGNRVQVSKPRSTNEYKNWYEEQISRAAGKILFDADDFAVMKIMKERLFSNRYIKTLLNNGEAEKSYYCDLELFNGRKIGVKVKPDYCKPQKRLIIDLKTCQDASVDGFTRHAADMNYQISAALYSDMLEKNEGKGLGWTFLFLAQEKTSPYAFNIFEASPQFISQGRYEYEKLLELYSWCKENDKWPGYQVFCYNHFGVNELKLPPWAIREIEIFEHRNL